jgi:hypothetical protein
VSRIGQPAGRWLALRWRGLGVAFVGIPLAAASLHASLEWIGRSFPGFFVMENGVVASVAGVDWPADKERLFHARVVAVDGEPVRGNSTIYDRTTSRPVGTSFAYTVYKGGGLVTIEQPSRRFTAGDWFQIYGILLFVGVLNLGTAIVVALLQPGTHPARIYVTTTFIGAAFALLSPFLHQAGYTLLTRAYLLAETLFGAAFIHMALLFPADRLAGRRRVLPCSRGLARPAPEGPRFLRTLRAHRAHLTYLLIAPTRRSSSRASAYRHADPSVRHGCIVLLAYRRSSLANACPHRQRDGRRAS